MEKSDEQLVKEYQEGNIQLFDEIFIRYKKIVEILCRKYFLYGLEKEDIYSEGYLGLIKAVNTYKEGESLFKTYASTCIINSVYSAIKKYSSSIRPLSIDDKNINIYLEDTETIDLEDKIVDGSNNSYTFDSLTKKLSNQEKQVLSYYLKGYKQKEISDKLSITTKAVERTISRVRDKIKKIIKRG